MPLHLPFNFPYFYNNFPRRYPIYHNSQYVNNSIQKNSFQSNSQNNLKEKKDLENNHNFDRSESSESFFEILGLKLYLDDIIIICILFFLYTEGVQDEELFICLILLLLT